MSSSEDKENAENLMKKPTRIPAPKSTKLPTKTLSETSNSSNARVLSSPSAKKSKPMSRSSSTQSLDK